MSIFEFLLHLSYMSCGVSAFRTFCFQVTVGEPSPVWAFARVYCSGLDSAVAALWVGSAELQRDLTGPVHVRGSAEKFCVQS